MPPFFWLSVMRLLVWLLRAALFVVLLGFAAKNGEPVALRFFFGTAWQLPLVAVMLIFFAAGAAVGVAAVVGVLFRQRRELARLRRESPRTGAAAPR